VREDQKALLTDALDHCLRDVLGLEQFVCQQGGGPNLVLESDLEHRGADTQRADARDLDSGVRVVDGEPFRNGNSGVLGDGVGKRRDLRQQARRGCGAHQVAVSAGDHIGQQGPCRPHVSHHVDLPDPLPVLVAALRASPGPRDPGVRDEHVDRSPLRARTRNQLHDLPLLRDVGADRERTEIPGDLLQTGLVEIGQHERPRALACDADGKRPSDAACGTGDHDVCAGKLHGRAQGSVPGPSMDFELSDRTKDYRERLLRFMDEHVYAAERVYQQQLSEAEDPHADPPVMEELKERAQELGLWNLFLPHEDPALGVPGLSNLEYAPLAEIMGRSHIAAEACNCSAPDTGNMEVLAQFGSPEQKDRWLRPLLDGEIRSAFAMTEPAVASSDATNIQLQIEPAGDEYVLNGRKWWISGAMRERCRIMIVMGKTDPGGHPYRQQSMVLVPRDADGVTIVRNLPVFGYVDQEGHAEIVFDEVRVPATNLVGGEGNGFLISQARLGPGRIHHCMRCIGAAERALELMCARAASRVTFGRRVAERANIQDWIAESRIEIEMARLLTMKAAWLMDTVGNKHARTEIAAIKIAAPNVALKVVDRAIQVHGGGGVSDDFPLAWMYAHLRTLRLADGPDEIHKRSIARHELRSFFE
jgi:acyl-CoA dehydrogenase